MSVFELIPNNFLILLSNKTTDSDAQTKTGLTLSPSDSETSLILCNGNTQSIMTGELNVLLDQNSFGNSQRNIDFVHPISLANK